MAQDLKDVISRADGLLADAMGVVCLIVILFGGLNLPLLF
jgi:hypothetical protein